MKLRVKYLDPFNVVKMMPNDTYDVLKYAECEGPKRTTTCAEYTKPWPNEIDEEIDEMNPQEVARREERTVSGSVAEDAEQI